MMGGPMWLGMAWVWWDGDSHLKVVRKWVDDGLLLDWDAIYGWILFSFSFLVSRAWGYPMRSPLAPQGNSGHFSPFRPTSGHFRPFANPQTRRARNSNLSETS